MAELICLKCGNVAEVASNKQDSWCCGRSRNHREYLNEQAIKFATDKAKNTALNWKQINERMIKKGLKMSPKRIRKLVVEVRGVPIQNKTIEPHEVNATLNISTFNKFMGINYEFTTRKGC